MKTCSDCGEAQPLSEFYTYKKKAGGESVYHFAHCKQCDLLRNQRTRARRKAEIAEANREREAEEAMSESDGVYVIGEVVFQDMLNKIKQSDEWMADFLSTLKPVRNAASVKSMRAKMQEAQENA